MNTNLQAVVSLSILVFTLLLPVAGHSEIYKWVDKQGRVHFSDQPLHSNTQPVEKITVKPTNGIARISTKSVFKSNPPNQSDNGANSTDSNARYAQVDDTSTSKEDYRCTLARKILNGEARLTRGRPTGEHEIEVAKRDIERFCR